jgi:hypothetical protein
LEVDQEILLQAIMEQLQVVNQIQHQQIEVLH